MVRKMRNDLIKDFLDDRHLRHYVSSRFGLHELSNVQVEFIRKTLKEMLIAPVNLIHYEPLISQIKLTDSTAVTDHNESLFYQELEPVFKRYIYG